MFKVSKQRQQEAQHSRITLFFIGRCFNGCINLPNMIGSFESGATASLGAKNGTEKLSQPFEELQGSNLESKLITPQI